MPTVTEETPLTLPTPAEWAKLLSNDGARGPHVVILYDDDWHTFDDVIRQVCKATECSLEKAEKIALEVHTKGRAIAYAGERERCEYVAAVLRQIRLQVETDSAC